MGLPRTDPELLIWLNNFHSVFGARALAELYARWGRHLLERWEAGESSLRIPLAEPVLA